MQQLPKPQCVIVASFKHAVSDHLKQLRPCLYVVQFEIVIWGRGGEEWTVEFLFIFSVEKKINQLKASEILRSLLLF